MGSERSLGRFAAACVLGLLCAAPQSAWAQYIGSSSSSGRSNSGGGGVPAVPHGTFIEQPLGPQTGDVTVMVGPLANAKFGTNEEAGLHSVRVPGVSFFGNSTGGETFWFLQAGLGFGVARGLELGIFTPPLLVAPEVAHGDVPVYIAWATTEGSFNAGLRSTLTIPTDTDSVWRWNPGLHSLARFNGGRFDLGAFFPMMFINDSTTIVGLEIPLRVTLDVSNNMFLGLETGIRKLDIGQGENDLFIPAGFHALYSLEAGDHSVDIAARFNWHSFFWAGAPEGIKDRLLQNAYMISLGATAHFDVGNGNRAE